MQEGRTLTRFVSPEPGSTNLVSVEYRISSGVKTNTGANALFLFKGLVGTPFSEGRIGMNKMFSLME
jgi:hypothetical protein